MSYLIPIDLNSIKKNKNAGQTVTTLPGRKEIRFETKELPNDFIDGENCSIQELQYESENVTIIKGLITDDKLLEKYWNSPMFINIEISQEPHIIHHEPIPKYSYQYENIQIVCNNCGKETTTDKLEYDEVSTEGDPYYTYTKCPFCGTWNCVDLEYESIKAALKRKDIKL